MLLRILPVVALMLSIAQITAQIQRGFARHMIALPQLVEAPETIAGHCQPNQHIGNIFACSCSLHIFTRGSWKKLQPTQTNYPNRVRRWRFLTTCAGLGLRFHLLKNQIVL